MKREPDDGAALCNLAVHLRYRGQLNEALAFSRRSQASYENNPEKGPDHPHTLTVVNNVANCLSSLGRLDEAAPLLRRVLAAREAQLGPEHDETVAAVWSLASTLASLKQHAEAAELGRRAIAAVRETDRGSREYRARIGEAQRLVAECERKIKRQARKAAKGKKKGGKKKRGSPRR